MYIAHTENSDELTQWELHTLEKLDASFFIYYYKGHSWDGEGFAIWDIGDKYGYTYLRHCSCNGPLDDLNSIPYTLEQIKSIAEREYSRDYMLDVISLVEEKGLGK